jgi:NAD(P)-dependent dehydrogenase (short-subunit alcohol dehydrogenase family)
MTTPVILILGAGSNVGSNVARKFASNGYRVAMTSRSSPTSASKDDGYFHIQSDLVDPGSILSVFKSVEARLGIPNVVVFNGSLPSHKAR